MTTKQTPLVGICAARLATMRPLVMLDYDASTGIYTPLSNGRTVVAETTWLQIQTAGALRDWTSIDAIAMAIGAVNTSGRVNGTGRRRIREALHGRPVDSRSEMRRGRQTTLYRLSPEAQS